MTLVNKVALVSLIALASASAQNPKPPDAKQRLWAAIGVSKPLYQLAEIEKLSVDFVVVNENGGAVDPGIGSSHLFINGVEPNDWSFVIINGIRSSNFYSLTPGEVLSFGYQLGPRYFAKPGIYVVRWEVGGVRSPDITFRVLPAPKP
jgi:hypothetical protein